MKPGKCEGRDRFILHPSSFILFFLTCYLALATGLFAQTGPAKTTIADTLYAPNGSKLAGTLRITNGTTFTSADGYVVPAGSEIAVNVVDGAFSVDLIPNVGATPSGTHYRVNYFLTSTARPGEIWVIPATPTSVNLLDVRAVPLPAPSLMLAFAQLIPPTGCLDKVPAWTGTAWVCSAAPGGREATFNLETPSTSDSGKYGGYYSRTVTIVKVSCNTDGLGTVSVNFEIRPEDSPNSAGTTVLAAPLTCTGSGTSTTSILNDVIPGTISFGYFVTLTIPATSGTPGKVWAAVVTR